MSLNLVAYPPNTTDVKTFGNIVKVLATGQSTVVDSRGMSMLTITTEAASTATYSRVLSDAAVADSSATAGNGTVAIATRLPIIVDFPFFRITAGGTGNINIACV